VVAAFTGRREPPHWSVPEEPFTVWDLKALLEGIVETAWRGGARVAPAASDTPFSAVGDSFVVTDGQGREVGWGGRVRSERVDAPVWADAVWGLEITLPSPVPERRAAVHHPLPLYPAVERDLALLVTGRTSAEAVAALIRQRAGALLEDVALFDHYRSEGLPPGTRSVALRLRFRAPDRTLKDKEVDRAVEGIVGRLKEELGVERRA
jgi:phenylalanyl-tRNA synthetase beta chain